MLPNPHRLTRRNRDDRPAEMMGKTIEFFENRGKVALKRDEHDRAAPSSPRRSCARCSAAPAPPASPVPWPSSAG
jgi:hypothetical protein